MRNISDNLFVHPNHRLIDGLELNILKLIEDSNKIISDRYSFHQFRMAVYTMFKVFTESYYNAFYPGFSDERFIITAVAGLLSGKTVITNGTALDDDVRKITEILVEDLDEELYNQLIDDNITNNKTGVIIFHTSGSTGVPKHIPLSWLNIMACIHSFYMEPSISHRDLSVALYCLPKSHIYGFIMELLFTTTSTRMHYSSPMDLYRRYMTIRPSVLPIVPQILNIFYEKRLPLNVELLICAGAPVRDEVREFYSKTCPQFLNGYGTTESTACISLSMNSNDNGICTIFNTISISPEGELLAKGPTINRDSYDSDGWYHTKDLAFIDDNNRLHLIGRACGYIKLQQGEFINLDELTRLYSIDGAEVCVYANSLDRYPNIVVYLSDDGISVFTEDVLRNKFNDIHKHHGRKGFERINDIVVRNIKDLPITDTMKPDYHNIRTSI